MKSCSFTGYRIEKLPFSEDSIEYKNLLDRIHSQILNLYNKNFTTFISGMSTGADMICAEYILELKKSYSDIKLLCAIPYPNQSDKWTDLYKIRYKNILNLSDKNILITPSFEKNSYKKRNEYLVNNCDILLAIFDNSAPNVRSGTAQTVRLAKKQNKSIIYINPNLLK